MPISESLTGAKQVLQSVFGHRQFIGKQEEIIGHLLAGRHCLALMPTGGGKSLCYQIPALLGEGVVIVVSPLIALMKNQVDGLRQNNVRAACLNSSLSVKQSRDVREACLNGELDLLYIAPERLMTDDGLALVKKIRVRLIAIDEAHCISQWGHDFRPEYLRLGELAEQFPDIPRLALTATADAQTRKEILVRLKMEDAETVVASFDRPNIRYAIRPAENRLQQFIDFYKREHDGHAGIIYCMSRRRAESIAETLENNRITALPYHAGMINKTRSHYQDRFLREEGVVICATIAFGMGIDKPDVRFVAHLDLPKSVEGYYQETGRAGRDGRPADAILFYSVADAFNIRKLIDDGQASESIRRIEHQKLNALLTLCESVSCRRTQILNYFGEDHRAPCNNCDNCLHPPETYDGTETAQKFLSAAYRTGQRFGVGHLVDILTGKITEKITRLRHNTLPTFGVGSTLPAAEWKRLGRQIIAAGLLVPDIEYGSLRLSEKGLRVLRGDETIAFTRRIKKTAREKTPRRRTDLSLSEDEQFVFDALRAERARLAAQQNVPAYIIFHDIVLVELARQLPTDHDAFSRIPGVGEAKTERYADLFIKKIKALIPDIP